MARGRTTPAERSKGVPLSIWMQESQRPWPRVVELLRMAAQELAELHSEGRVHGRMSPDAVAISNERAYLVDSVPPHASYRAPEGDPVTRASDQYTFCAVLFTVLVGHAPNEGQEPGEESWPRWPNTLPAWVGHVVLRGLSTTPGERWPSMAAVARALAPRRAHPRRGILVAGSVALAAVTAWVFVPVEADPCAQGPAAWDRETQASVRGALQTAAPHADGPLSPAQLDRIVATMGDWEGAYRQERRRVCAGEAIAAELVPAAFACLTRIAERHSGLTKQLSTADGTVATHVESAISSLPPPTACLDADRLRAEPPVAPRDRREVAEIDAELERARALLSVGRNEAAQREIDRALSRAVDLDHAATLGRAQWLAGATTSRSGDTTTGIALMERAIATLTAAGAPRDAAKVALTLAATFESRGDPERALQWGMTAFDGYDKHGATEYERATLDATLERIRRSLAR